MRAIKYKGVHNLEMLDIPKPVPGRGEVLVKVLYCGICGTDVHAYHLPGVYDWEMIPGHETVGIVEEVGEGIDFVKQGDHVAVGPPGDCGMCYTCNTGHPNVCPNAFPNTMGIGPGTQGAFSEYVLSKFPKNELFLIPEGMRLKQAVLFDVLGVGFHAVRRSEVKVGDTVVVFGCGAIGLSVIQTAKLAGARTIIAFDTKESTLDRTLKAGADYAFLANDENMDKARKILAHEKGAHVCFEAVGRASALQGCIDLCMPEGQIMVIGSDGNPFELVSAAMGPMEYDLKFSFTYTKEEIYMLFEMIREGKFPTDLYKTCTVPLEDAEKMIIKQMEGKLDVVRVLLAPHGDIEK